MTTEDSCPLVTVLGGSYDSANFTSRLPSDSVSWNDSLERLSDEEAENRCFPTKAVAIWHQLDDQGHMRLVEEYLREAGNFENVRDVTPFSVPDPMRV